MTEERESEGTRGGRRRWPIVLAGILVLVVVLGLAVWSGLPVRPGPAIRIADVSSERLLASGSVVGFAAESETHAWLGIPYARPPVGELRWRAPRPPEAWVDTRDALAAGPPCPQLASKIGGVEAEDESGFAGQEDCLTLNVWAPRSEPDAIARGRDRLPVMVWIHGGGNRVGHASAPMSDGARLAGTQDVVVVSVNYRLGPFGWLSHPALRAEAEDAFEASGNFGTLDQIEALRWVRTNIAEFGGDPGNVTIFGESAGGTNVLALLRSPPARGLFHRAIAQSGSTESVSRAEAENALTADPPGQRHASAEIVVSLLEAAGVVPDREAARRYAEALPAADLREFLRGRSAREVLAVYRSPEDPSKIELPRLVRDGALLPEVDGLVAFRAGRFHAVPVLLGSNRDEMKLFLSQDGSHVRRRLGLFHSILDPEDYERRARHHSDLWTARAVDQPAAALMASGRTTVFAYRFDWDEEPKRLGTDLSRLLGAAHGFELPFLFGTFDLGDPVSSRAVFPEETRASRELLGERMRAYWAEFARTGRPGRGGREDLPEWLAWSTDGSDDAQVLLLDTDGGGGIRVARTRMTRESVIAAVEAEVDLGRDEKCAMLLDLFPDRDGRDAEALRLIRRHGCREADAAGGAPHAAMSPRAGGLP